VEDEVGKTDVANMKINVESTVPIAQFTMEPKIEGEYPSEFILDAGPSSDVDEINGFDTLSYERKFSDLEQTTVERDGEDNEKVLVTFNKM